MLDLLNKVYIGDVFEFLDILPNNSVDLAIIDPPYNLKIASWDSFKSEDEFLEFSFAWLDKLLPKLKKSGSFYIFNTPYNCALFINHLRDKKVYFKNFITWHKKDGLSCSKTKFNNSSESILFYTVSSTKYYFNCDEIRVPYDSKDRIKHAAQKGILKNGKRWYPNPNGKLCTDVWEITSQRHKEKVNGKIIKPKHPSIKPHEMIERIIKASSKEGDLVLDLFAGSGGVCKIAQNLGRNFTGCEKKIEYLYEDLETIQG